jgi:hypothetical protein
MMLMARNGPPSGTVDPPATCGRERPLTACDARAGSGAAPSDRRAAGTGGARRDAFGTLGALPVGAASKKARR